MKISQSDDKTPMMERRRFIRHPVCFPLSYRTLEKNASRDDDRVSTTVNLGLGGLMFLAKEPVGVNAKIVVKMPFQDKVFNVRGKVVRCEKSKAEQLYDIGVSFYMLSDAFKAKLIEQMYRISEFRDLLSIQQGKEVQLEEASKEWIKKYSKRFKTLYW
ncbi:MAG: PilZ domain-containing protein [Candidatus Omnitrophota bacterium]